MTIIDNETGLTVYRDIATVLDSYRDDNHALGDSIVLANAITDASNKLAKALKSRKFDEAQGIASHLHTYADKAKSLAKTLAIKGVR